MNVERYCLQSFSYLRAFDVIMEIVSERVNEVDGLLTGCRILEVTRKQDYKRKIK